MNLVAQLDWQTLWVPAAPLGHVMLRGTVMYLGLVLLFRFLRRNAGSLTMADLLLVVLIADASQNGMTGDYRSITEGAVLVSTIAGWSYLLDWLSFRFPAVERLLGPPPLPLVRDGVLLHRNLRRELITRNELDSQMRQQGIARIEDVHRCYLEPDGKISMIPAEKPGKNRGRKDSREIP